MKHKFLRTFTLTLAGLSLVLGGTYAFGQSDAGKDMPVIKEYTNFINSLLDRKQDNVINKDSFVSRSLENIPENAFMVMGIDLAYNNRSFDDFLDKTTGTTIKDLRKDLEDNIDETLQNLEEGSESADILRENKDSFINLSKIDTAGFFVMPSDFELTGAQKDLLRLVIEQAVYPDGSFIEEYSLTDSTISPYVSFQQEDDIVIQDPLQPAEVDPPFNPVSDLEEALMEKLIDYYVDMYTGSLSKNSFVFFSESETGFDEIKNIIESVGSEMGDEVELSIKEDGGNAYTIMVESDEVSGEMAFAYKQNGYSYLSMSELDTSKLGGNREVNLKGGFVEYFMDYEQMDSDFIDQNLESAKETYEHTQEFIMDMADLALEEFSADVDIDSETETEIRSLSKEWVNFAFDTLNDINTRVSGIYKEDWGEKMNLYASCSADAEMFGCSGRERFKSSYNDYRSADLNSVTLDGEVATISFDDLQVSTNKTLDAIGKYVEAYTKSINFDELRTLSADTFDMVGSLGLMTREEVFAAKIGSNIVMLGVKGALEEYSYFNSSSEILRGVDDLVSSDIVNSAISSNLDPDLGSQFEPFSFVEDVYPALRNTELKILEHDGYSAGVLVLSDTEESNVEKMVEVLNSNGADMSFIEKDGYFLVYSESIDDLELKINNEESMDYKYFFEIDFEEMEESTPENISRFISYTQDIEKDSEKVAGFEIELN
jgi:hypothetical protein